MADMSIEVRGADELVSRLPKINTRAVLAAGAGEYKAMWQGHFKALDALGNKKGFPSRNFWITEGVRKTDVAELTKEQARVTCDSRAVALRATGGTIRPVSAGALATPVSPQAYAAGWPRNCGIPLEFVPIKNSRTPAVRGKLVEAAATRISYGRDGSVRKGKGNAKTVVKTHYLLLSKVEIKPMGDGVKPDAGLASAAVRLKMGEAVQRQVERKAQG